MKLTDRFKDSLAFYGVTCAIVTMVLTLAAANDVDGVWFLFFCFYGLPVYLVMDLTAHYYNKWVES